MGLKYYAYMKDAPVSYMLRQACIKTENHLMDFPNCSWQDCPVTGRSTGAYIIFDQGGPIDHITHVPGPVSRSSAETEYNAECTAVMALSHFRMLIHDFLNKNPYIFPEEAPLIVLDSKYAMCMADNGNYKKHT